LGWEAWFDEGMGFTVYSVALSPVDTITAFSLFLLHTAYSLSVVHYTRTETSWSAAPKSSGIGFPRRTFLFLGSRTATVAQAQERFLTLHTLEFPLGAKSNNYFTGALSGDLIDFKILLTAFLHVVSLVSCHNFLSLLLI
jgi:hypothetical protein